MEEQNEVLKRLNYQQKIASCVVVEVEHDAEQGRHNTCGTAQHLTDSVNGHEPGNRPFGEISHDEPD